MLGDCGDCWEEITTNLKRTRRKMNKKNIKTTTKKYYFLSEGLNTAMSLTLYPRCFRPSNVFSVGLDILELGECWWVEGCVVYLLLVATLLLNLLNLLGCRPLAGGVHHPGHHRARHRAVAVSWGSHGGTLRCHAAGWRHAWPLQGEKNICFF